MIFSGSPSSFDQLLTRAAAVALGAALVWSVVLLLAVLVEAATDGRVRLALALGCPRSVHRLLLAAMSAVLSAAVLVPGAAQAEARAPAPSAPPAGTFAGTFSGTSAGLLDGLPLPDRTTGGPGPGFAPATTSHPEPRARTSVSVSAWVTVRAGDSLWAISRTLLPRTAGPPRIDQLAHQLHDRNRRTIGADPDVIQPGQRLAVPLTAPETDPEDS